VDRSVSDGFKFNKETEFVPVLGLVAAQLNAPAGADADAKADADAPRASAASVRENHHSVLLALVADELGVGADAIYDFELHLYDTQPATLGGAQNEFVFAPRLDNQLSSFCAAHAMASYASSAAFRSATGAVPAIALFNHEEVGSVSSSGAQSSLVPALLAALGGDAAPRATARSFLLSCDVGHAVHPNYTSKHEQNHRPVS
jgi:aspartyl aminopeptidase